MVSGRAVRRSARLPSPYVARARRMLQVAVEHDLVPSLVVLWCNYVPETWASGADPRFVMSGGARSDYVARRRRV